MSGQAARAYMTIGEVLARLRADFPDITISKIRFLESEGLIEPERSPSGYRKFIASDVQRLSMILSAQRDNYLPLKVIKDHLDAVDRGENPDPLAATKRPVLVTEDTLAGPVRMTRRQLAEKAGATEELIEELDGYGLIRRESGGYDADALTIATTAVALGAFGLQVRHLRSLKAAADREINLVEQVVSPMLRRRGPAAHGRAEQTGHEVSVLTARLHRALVTSGLRELLQP